MAKEQGAGGFGMPMPDYDSADGRIAAMNEVAEELQQHCGWSDDDVQQSKAAVGYWVFAASLSEAWRIDEEAEANSGFKIF